MHRSLLLCFVLLAACGGKKEAPSAAAAPVAPQVSVAPVEAFEAPPALNSSASFASIDSAELSPETEGVVREVFVRVGDSVAAGTPLLRIENKEAQWKLEEAKARSSEILAALRQAEARLGKDGQRNADLAAEVLSAQATVDSSEEEVRLAEIEESRAARLRATKDISQASYDRARSTLQSAQARLRGARQQLAAARNGAQQSTQGVAMVKAQLESAQAQEAQARKRLTDTILRAPFAGVVTARSISVGEYVNPQAKPLRLDRVDPVKLVFQLPETQAAQVKAGLEVEARVSALPGEVFHGKLRTPNGALDTNSRSLTVEAEFANPQRKLKPGYFAEAKVLLGGVEPKLRLPAAALDFDPRTETYRVWTYADGKVKLHLVGQPQKQGDKAELRKTSSAGIAQGNKVVLNPPSNLFEGMAVTVPSEAKK